MKKSFLRLIWLDCLRYDKCSLLLGLVIRISEVPMVCCHSLETVRGYSTPYPLYKQGKLCERPYLQLCSLARALFLYVYMLPNLYTTRRDGGLLDRCPSIFFLRFNNRGQCPNCGNDHLMDRGWQSFFLYLLNNHTLPDTWGERAHRTESLFCYSNVLHPTFVFCL